MTVAKHQPASRTYRSALREEQARRTRAAVLDAATECFVEDGYTATTMKDVARRAGVSVETVYAQGSKASLLIAVVDRTIVGDDEPVALRDRPEMQQVRGAPSAAEVLDRLRVVLVEGIGESLPVLMAFERAAGADPEIAAVHADYDGRRRSDMLLMAQALGPGLRPGVGVEEAADVLSSLLSTPLIHQFVEQHGWGVHRFAEWVMDAAHRLLLDGGTGDRT